MTPLMSLRGRIAYWEKRIELARSKDKREQLTLFAWAEIARSSVTYGVQAYRELNGKSAEFVKAMQQALVIAAKR